VARAPAVALAGGRRPAARLGAAAAAAAARRAREREKVV
jgi:hypothetical protein